MSIITDQNRDSLLKNPNVKNLTGKQIVYTSKFIQSALKRYGEGGSARIIWLDAGFEIESFKKGYFRKCLNRWKSQLINGNVSPLVRGKSKIDFQSRDEENAYLKAEVSLLKELRALGVEGRITGSVLSLELFRQMKNSQQVICVESVALANQASING